MNANEIATAAQEIVELRTATQNATEVRKMAAGFGIKGASKGRKAELIAAMVALEVERITKEEEAKAASAKAKPAKSTKCEVCGTRKINTKTQGRDSTMCAPCFDYAGWENTHTDNGHESLPANHVERLECPICQEADPGAVRIAHPKAAQFANAAKAAGWDVRVVASDDRVKEVRRATFTVVVKSEDEEISLSWEAGLYDYDASNYIDPKGCRKVRNTSAAIQIIQAKVAS